jgi:cation transport ATPase
LGIERVIGGVLPQEKALKIKEFQVLLLKRKRIM